MSIDPRIMKTLLQLQWMPSLDFTGSSSPNILSSGSQEDPSLFGTILSQMLSGSGSSLQENSGLQALNDELASITTLFKQPLPFYNEPDLSMDNPTPTLFDPYINEASAKYGVDPSLVKAVIDTESAFNPYSVSSAGAKGLMQLMDGTARGLGVENSFDPQQNIEGGTRYLAYLLGKYGGSEQAALAAYNAGPGRVDRAGISNNEDFAQKLGTLPAETQRYVGKVLAALEQYSPSNF